jgi:hypothetical protein
MFSSLAGLVWIGCCPECLQMPEMLLNSRKAYECPECHLQIHTNGQVTAMAEKGTGNFIVRHGVRVSAVDSYDVRHHHTIRVDLRASG